MIFTRQLATLVQAGRAALERVAASERDREWRLALSTDGSIKAMQQLDSSGLYAAPLVDGDTLYVQSRDGKLYALKRP